MSTTIADSAERVEALEAALRELVEAGKGAYHYLNNVMYAEHTEEDCKLCETADPLGNALVSAKAALGKPE